MDMDYFLNFMLGIGEVLRCEVNVKFLAFRVLVCIQSVFVLNK